MQRISEINSSTRTFHSFQGFDVMLILLLVLLIPVVIILPLVGLISFYLKYKASENEKNELKYNNKKLLLLMKMDNFILSTLSTTSRDHYSSADKNVGLTGRNNFADILS